MRTIVARFYHIIIFIWFLFGCGDQQKDSISQEESEEIHELINQLMYEKENDKWKYLFSIQLVMY